MTKLLLILMFISTTVHSVGFSVVEPFFDRKAWEEKMNIRDIKPENCPDGSKFLALDFLPIGAKKMSEIASCFYFDEKNELIIEHVWEEGLKIGEFSLVNDIQVGPEVSKTKNMPYFISEYCDGALIRTEIVNEANEVLAIFLYLEGAKEPSVVINYIDPNNNKRIDLVEQFEPCDYGKYQIESKAFNKWLNRDWHPLTLLPAH